MPARLAQARACTIRVSAPSARWGTTAPPARSSLSLCAGRTRLTHHLLSSVRHAARRRRCVRSCRAWSVRCGRHWPGGGTSEPGAVQQLPRALDERARQRALRLLHERSCVHGISTPRPPATAAQGARSSPAHADYFDNIVARNASVGAKCRRCFRLGDVTCAANVTLATVNVSVGHWRLGNKSRSVRRCHSNSAGVSPCRGGVTAAEDGRGYCEPGQHGPRCELCDDPNAFYS